MSKRRELKAGDLVRITKVTDNGVTHFFNVGDVVAVTSPSNTFGNVECYCYRRGYSQVISRGAIAYDRKANADKAKYEARRG